MVAAILYIIEAITKLEMTWKYLSWGSQLNCVKGYWGSQLNCVKGY